jgi:RHS repeat-associated protein
VITDVTGQEVRRLAYNAFGEEVQNTGSGDAPPYTYTGKELDDTGLLYYGARYYDPILCRFLTPDTVYDGNSPQGLNRYSYALNNPIIYRDPTGYQSVFPTSSFWESIFGQHLAQEIHGTEQALTTIASDATEQVIYGNYTDKGNVVGTTAMILAGGLGIDLPADLRDVVYDVTHWQTTWGHAAQTAVDAVALLPLVGTIKYVDEVKDVLKASKKATFIATESGEIIFKTALDEIQSLPEFGKMTKAEIEAELLVRGYKRVPANSGGDVWTKPFPDGKTVGNRLDPANLKSPPDFADAKDHAHKELVETSKVKNGNYDYPDTLQRFDDQGNVKSNKDFKDIHIHHQ